MPEPLVTESCTERSSLFQTVLLAAIGIGVILSIILQVVLLVEGRNKAFVGNDPAAHDALGKMSDQLQQQTAVLHRALGTIIPVQMPPEWEAQLTELEVQAGTRDRWPADVSQAAAFNEKTASLITSLPAWAEADYLPRLTAVRWTALAFDALAHATDESERFFASEEMAQLAGAMPDLGSAELQKHLENESAGRLAKWNQEAYDKAIKAAKAHINSGKAFSDDDLANLLTTRAMLEAYRFDESKTDEVSKLCTNLDRLILTQQAQRQANSLAERWKTIQVMQSKQPELFEAALGMLLQEVTLSRLSLNLEGISEPDLDAWDRLLRRRMVELATRAEAKQEKAIQAYQRWALKNCKDFEHKFTAAQQQAEKDASTFKADNGGWSNARYKDVRDAMVQHLLPINLGLLDMPVQERYERAFRLGWNQLDGRDDQTYVAERTALVKKIPLRGFMESKP